jgi:hypothetical protein
MGDVMPFCIFFCNNSCSSRKRGGVMVPLCVCFFAALAMVRGKRGAKCPPLCFFSQHSL